MMWIIFLLFSLGGLCTKTDEAKTAKVTDLQLLTPTVTRQYKPCTPGKSAGSKCVVQCSVTNAPNATLTIFNGTSTFSIIKVADLNIDLSLCMEVQHQDTNPYRCVMDNTHSSQAVQFNAYKICQPCPDLTKTSVPVTEGDSVTVRANVTKEQKVSHVMWMFECNPNEMTLIAEICDNATDTYQCIDGRFKDRLRIDSQTGDLTITNTSKRESGVFKLQINNGDSKCWSYNVTVYALLPVPVITRNSSSSTDSRCSVLCSVANVSAASLSWYKGNRSLSSISVSDLSISLSLPLEVENQDKNTYSCVVNNPIRNKTTPLDISDLCPDSSNPIWIKYIVAVVLAVVAVLAVGAYLIYIYCPLRKGAGSQKQTSQNPQSDDENQDQNSQNSQTDDEDQDQNSQNSQTDDGSQNETSQNPQTANTEANETENESAPFISDPSSTQQSICLSKLCCK